MGYRSAMDVDSVTDAAVDPGRRSARAELLDRALAHVRAHGWAGRSLRDLAAGIGTSHRMLIHHFGSREGLLVEMVRATEAAERAAAAAVRGGDLDTALRAGWARFTDPAAADQERLFFELHALGLRGVEPAASMLPDLVHDWLDTVPAERRPLMRLAIATVRGLLLDRLSTGEHADVDEAFSLFVSLVARQDSTA
jgi:AcrR family transcriptional regulator